MLPGGSGPVQFCAENDDNCPDNETLFRNLVLVVERQIFFSSHNEAYRDNFTKHEQYIMDNYAKYLPQLMYKVYISVEKLYEKLKLYEKSKEHASLPGHASNLQVERTEDIMHGALQCPEDRPWLLLFLQHCAYSGAIVSSEGTI